MGTHQSRAQHRLENITGDERMTRELYHLLGGGFLLGSHMAHLSVNLMAKSHTESYSDQFLGTKIPRMSPRIPRERWQRNYQETLPFFSLSHAHQNCLSHESPVLKFMKTSISWGLSGSFQEAICNLGPWLDKRSPIIPTGKSFLKTCGVLEYSVEVVLNLWVRDPFGGSNYPFTEVA